MERELVNFFSLLTEEDLKELGEVDETWFEAASQNERTQSWVTNLEKSVNEEGFNSPRVAVLEQQESSIDDESFLCKDGISPLVAKCRILNDQEKSPQLFGFNPDTEEIGCKQQWQHSPLDHITLSLGATMGGHDLSWTSSMATPVARDSVFQHEHCKNTNFPKRLFDSEPNQGLTDDTSLLEDSGVDSVIINCDRYLRNECNDASVIAVPENCTTSQDILSSSKNLKGDLPIQHLVECKKHPRPDLCNNLDGTEKKVMIKKKWIIDYQNSNLENDPSIESHTQIHADCWQETSYKSGTKCSSHGEKFLKSNQPYAFSKHSKCVSFDENESVREQETFVPLIHTSKLSCCQMDISSLKIQDERPIINKTETAASSGILTLDINKKIAYVEKMNAALQSSKTVECNQQNQSDNNICGTESEIGLTGSFDLCDVNQTNDIWLNENEEISKNNVHNAETVGAEMCGSPLRQVTTKINAACSPLSEFDNEIKAEVKISLSELQKTELKTELPVDNSRFSLSDEKCLTSEPHIDNCQLVNCDKSLKVMSMQISSSIPTTILFGPSELDTAHDKIICDSENSELVPVSAMPVPNLHLENLSNSQGYHDKGSHAISSWTIDSINGNALSFIRDEHNYAKLPQCNPDSAKMECSDHGGMPLNDDDFDFNVTQHLEFAEMTDACLKSMENDSVLEDSHCDSLPHLDMSFPNKSVSNGICILNASEMKAINSVENFTDILSVAEPFQEKSNTPFGYKLADGPVSDTLKQTAFIGRADAREIRVEITSNTTKNSNTAFSPSIANAIPILEVLKNSSKISNKFIDSTSKGLPTVNGKKTTSTEKCMEGSRSMSLDASFSPIISENANNQNISTALFEGFSMASGKKISFSNSALEKAKCLLSFDSDKSSLSENGFQRTRVGHVPVDLDKVIVPTVIDQNISETVGFSTASGKKVFLSKSALEKAKCLFSEEDLSHISKPAVVITHGTDAKSITTSLNEKSLEKERAASEMGLSHSRGTEILNGQNVSTSFCEGFSTASEKKVSFSESSLERAKGLFLKEGFSQIFELDVIVHEKNVECKKASLSENPLDKTKAWFSDAVIPTSVNDQKSFTTCEKKASFSRSASDNVKHLFSEKGLSKKPESNVAAEEKCSVGITSGVFTSKLIAEDKLLPSGDAYSFNNEAKALETSKENQQINDFISKYEQPPTDLFKGFSTASGKKVLISKGALERARTSFSEIGLSQMVTGAFSESTKISPVDNYNVVPVLRKCDDISDMDSLVIKGNLRTESPVSISSLKYTEEKPDCTGLNLLQEAISIREMPIDNLSHCFSTASGKKVTVSERDLEAAKTLFCDMPCSIDQEGTSTENHVVPETDVVEHNKLTPDRKIQCFQGFATASGKSLHVSEAALQNAQKMLSSPVPSKDASEFKHNRDTCTIAEETSTKTGTFRNHQGTATVSSRLTVLPPRTLHRDGIRHMAKFNATDISFLSNTEVNPMQCRISKVYDGSEHSVAPNSVLSSNKERLSTATSLKRSLDTYSVTPVDLQGIKRVRCNGNLTEDVSSAADLFVKNCDLKFCPGASVSNNTLDINHNSYTALNDEEKPHFGRQITPKLGVLDKGWSDIPDEFFKESFDIDELASNCQKSAVYRDHKLGKCFKITELDAETLPPKRTSIETVVECNSCHTDEVSMEILESTEAFLADELVASPVKNKAPPEVLSRAPNHPMSGNSETEKYPQNYALKVNVVNNCQSSAVEKHLGLDKCTPSVLTSRCNKNKDNHHSALNTALDDCYHAPAAEQKIDVEMVSKRKTAFEEQMHRITDREKHKILPVPGVRWKERQCATCLRRLHDVVGGVVPCRLTDNEALGCGIKKSTLNVNSRNAHCYKFVWSEHVDAYSNGDTVGVVRLKNGSCLIFDDKNLAGVKEFYRSLVDTSGVDSKLISETWVANHYRWIIWKLAAMEVSFARLFAGRLLTPDEVMQQLHYRYNREIDFCERSALKKIIERDDTPAKTLVLCVAGIFEIELPANDSSAAPDTSTSMSTIMLEVTDGWYSIKAILDEPLCRLTRTGKLVIGQKLIVHGAELIGPSDACSPLEAPSDLFLKLNANCCRRARWDLKLGYFPSPCPFPLPLKSLFVNGGLVGCVDIVVSRIFPIQYLEKHDDGTNVFYNEKTNSMAAYEFEIKKDSFMEKILLEAENRLNHDEAARAQKTNRHLSKRNFSNDEIRNLTNGAEILEALNISLDPSVIQDCLSGTQQKTLSDFRLTLLERKRLQLEAEIQQTIKNESSKSFVERNVIPFLKFRGVCCFSKNCSMNSSCIITLWNPTTILENLIKEGKSLRIYYLLARPDCSRHGKELQLAFTKRTRIEEKCVSDDIIQKIFSARQLVPFETISKTDFKPLFGEIDIIGLVVQVNYKEQSQFDFVYIADSKMNIIAIKFWGGLKSFGVQEMLKPKTFVLASNLQWRGRTASSLIQYLYTSQISSFTQHPKEQHFKVSLNELRHSLLNLDEFVNKAVEKITSLNKKNPCYYNLNTPSPKTPFLGKPVSTSTPLARHAVSEIECAMSPTVTVVSSEQSIQRSKLLEHYGAPPPLPTLYNQNSPLVKSRFRPPKIFKP